MILYFKNFFKYLYKSICTFVLCAQIRRSISDLWNMTDFLDNKTVAQFVYISVGNYISLADKLLAAVKACRTYALPPFSGAVSMSGRTVTVRDLAPPSARTTICSCCRLQLHCRQPLCSALYHHRSSSVRKHRRGHLVFAEVPCS